MSYAVPQTPIPNQPRMRLRSHRDETAPPQAPSPSANTRPTISQGPSGPQTPASASASLGRMLGPGLASLGGSNPLAPVPPYPPAPPMMPPSPTPPARPPSVPVRGSRYTLTLVLPPLSPLTTNYSRVLPALPFPIPGVNTPPSSHGSRRLLPPTPNLPPQLPPRLFDIPGIPQGIPPAAPLPVPVGNPPASPPHYIYYPTSSDDGPKLKEPDVFMGKDLAWLTMFISQCVTWFLGKPQKFTTDWDHVLFATSVTVLFRSGQCKGGSENG